MSIDLTSASQVRLILSGDLHPYVRFIASRPVATCFAPCSATIPLRGWCWRMLKTCPLMSQARAMVAQRDAVSQLWCTGYVHWSDGCSKPLLKERRCWY